MQKSIIVKDLPTGITEDKIVIYFQKRKNGGGDVENVKLLENDTKAVVEFADHSVVKTILERTHKLYGKVVQVENYDDPKTSHGVFLKIEAVISPKVLQKAQLGFDDLSRLANKCDNLKVVENGNKFMVVSNVVDELVHFQDLFEATLKFGKESSGRSISKEMQPPRKRSLSSLAQSSQNLHDSTINPSDQRVYSSFQRLDNSEIYMTPPMGAFGSPNFQSIPAASEASDFSSSWSDTPFPQPDDGITFFQEVSLDKGQKVIKRQFCFPEGVITMVPGEFITYPAYNCVVVLPVTPPGEVVNEMLQTAFDRRKLFYIGKNTENPGFVILSAYNIFGSNSGGSEIDLSSKLSEIKNRLKERDIPVPKPSSFLKRSDSAPVNQETIPMETAMYGNFMQAPPKKLGPFPQPDGLAFIKEFHEKDLAGFPGCGAIHMYFRFTGGQIQTDTGEVVRYPSYNRSACLPGNTLGRKLYGMILDAVEKKKLFVVAIKKEAFQVYAKVRLLSSDDYPADGQLDNLYASLLKLGVEPSNILPPLPHKKEAHYDDTPTEEEMKKEKEVVRKGGPFPQPQNGVMRIEKEPGNLKGFGNGGMLKLYFRFSGGKMDVQGSRPSISFQVQYRQMYSVAALPCNNDGKRLAAMLRRAFDDKQLFYVQKKDGEPNFKIRPHVVLLTADQYPNGSYLTSLKQQLQNLGIREPTSESLNKLVIHNSTTPQGGALPPGWGDPTSANTTPAVQPSLAPTFTSNGARPKLSQPNSAYSRKVNAGSRRNQYRFGPDVETDSTVFVKKEEDNCAICLMPLSQQKSRSLPCKHIFHQSCVNMALRSRSNCPTCNQPTANNNKAGLRKKNSPPTKAYKSTPSSTDNTGGSAGTSVDREEDKCAICLGPLSEQRKKKLPCSHEFHESCINTALQAYKKCPYCNQPVDSSGSSQPSNSGISGAQHVPSPAFSTPTWDPWRISPNALFSVPGFSTPPLVPQFPSTSSNFNHASSGRLGNQPSNGNMSSHAEGQSLPGFEGCGTIVIRYNFPGGVQQSGHPNPGVPYAGTQREAFLPSNSEGQNLLQLLRRAFNSGLTFTIGQSMSTGRNNQIIWNGIPHKTNRQGGPLSYGYPDPQYLRELRQKLSSMGIS